MCTLLKVSELKPPILHYILLVLANLRVVLTSLTVILVSCTENGGVGSNRVIWRQSRYTLLKMTTATKVIEDLSGEEGERPARCLITQALYGEVTCKL